MATDALMMASREPESAIPWEIWQRSHQLESAWMVNRFSMVFKEKSINTVDTAGKRVDGMPRPREPPTGGNKIIERRHWIMTREDKKTAIETMAENFMSISDFEVKSMTIMVMSAYAEGKAAGKLEERHKWEQKEAVAATA